MPKGIMIFGPAGAGKTTLGKMVAQELGFVFADIDDYIWRNDTETPFSAMYSRAEKISRLMDAISETSHFVMAGSMDSFHEHFDPFFVLAIHVTAPAEVRAARVHQREQEEFADRVLEGGDMYEAHQKFLNDAASYDYGGSTSLMLHTKWAEALQCPVLRLDGSDDLSIHLKTIVDTYKSVCTF